MAKTIVVGDSVALGIGQAIPGAQIIAEQGRAISTMQPLFNSALATAAQGDTVILSAGYNSTGPNGLATADLATLQTAIDALHAKGAKVVIAPLRETGMTGNYAPLNGLTAKTNEQLAGLKNATFAKDALPAVNGIANGEIHGAYADLARISMDAAKTAAPVATGAGLRSEADREADGAAAASKEQGWGEWLSEIFNTIIKAITDFFKSFGGGDENDPPATGNAPATQVQAPAQEEGKVAPDAKTQAAAAAAAQGNSAAGTAADVESNGVPALPVAQGARVKQ